MSDCQSVDNGENENSDCSFDEDFEEDVDPRVQGELESLNSASDEINKLETEIEKAKNKFKGRLADSSVKLNILHKKLGRCVNKCRPFYEIFKQSRQAQAEAQKAALNFQRANHIYEAAKETVGLAEKKIVDSKGDQREFDSAWQEMLNHATIKFMQSEKNKKESEAEHMKKAAEHSSAQAKLRVLEKDLPHSISRSRPYYDLKEKLEYVLQLERQSVDALQQALVAAKGRYKASLEKLEAISEEIHMQRRLKLKLPQRTPGVGAEKNADSIDLPSINLDMKSETSSFVSFDDDADSLVLSSPDGHPSDWRRHQRSVSQDWVGNSFPFPQRAANGTQPVAASVKSGAALRRGFQSSPHMIPETIQKENEPVAALDSAASTVDTNDTKSNTSSTDNQSTAAITASAPVTNSTAIRQEPAPVACREIQVDTQVEHMKNVDCHYESRVGTGLSTEMSKLVVVQKNRPPETSAAQVANVRQSSRTATKKGSSQEQRSRNSRSKSASRTPSQAFPILVGLSQCNRQSSPKLSRAKLDTSASGYNSDWQRQGVDSFMDQNFYLPRNQQYNGSQ